MDARRTGLGILLAGAALLVGGCASPTPTAAKTHHHHQKQPVSSGPTSASSSPSPASPTACATADLDGSLANMQGTAGSTYVDVVLTNTGSAPCTLAGFPGVSYVGKGNGTQVGAPAGRSGSGGTTVTLQPGDRASAVLQETEAGNYSASKCGPLAVDGLRVYPPDQTAALFIKQPGATGCTNKGVKLLFVRAMQPAH